MDAQLGRISADELRERRNVLMESYVRASNGKIEGLYLDIIDAAEYDPMLSHSMGIKYSSAAIHDPLKVELAGESRGSPRTGGRAAG